MNNRVASLFMIIYCELFFSVSGQKTLEVNYDIVEDNVVIRKPGVNIAEDFKLILQPWFCPYLGFIIQVYL